MYINRSLNQPHFSQVLHIVDEATGFQAYRQIYNISSQTVLNKLHHFWIDTYKGPQNILVHDVGKKLISKVFKST